MSTIKGSKGRRAANGLAPTGLNESADLRPLPEQIAELERRAIAAALARTGGNRTAAARLLGISRASLYDRLAALPELSEYQTIV